MSAKKCDKERVLVVDDDSATRDLYAAIINDDIPEVKVDLAVNGAEAVKMFQASRQSVILMDLSMPVMDGITAFRQIGEYCAKSGDEMPKVVFCTSYAPPETLKAVLSAGESHGFLNKPMTSDKLLKAVRERL
ncbi:MAG: response regulator [Lentisphaerales bacterium]|jgi:CheY-like chemotaxis protein|nr:MAG: response regulator [Lentisphaerales bacterium]